MEKKQLLPFLAGLALILAAACVGLSLFLHRDRTAPVLVVVDSFQTKYDQTISVYQLIDSVNDRSSFTVSMTGNGQVSEDGKSITFTRPGAYPVQVTAEDAHGNQTVKTVVIDVVDDIAPEITAEDFTAYLGEEPQYQEYVSAYDALDGDLTAAVSFNDSQVDLETPGRYVVTYSVSDQAGNSSSCTAYVTISRQPATEIVLDETIMQLGGNQYEQIEVTISPSDWEGEVVWTSSDPSVATVSGGLVSWVGKGSCTITATADEVSAQCEVTCGGTSASDIWLSIHTLTLSEENPSSELTTQVWPSNWSGDVVWSSSNTAVATVDNGVVTWVGPGSCKITATADDKTDVCEVTCKSKGILDILDGLFGSKENPSGENEQQQDGGNAAAQEQKQH